MKPIIVSQNNKFSLFLTIYNKVHNGQLFFRKFSNFKKTTIKL